MKNKTEVKDVQTQEPAKSNKKYIVLALVVILAILGIVSTNSNKEEIIVSDATENAVATEPAPAEIEPTVARIDLSTKPYAEEANFEVYIDGSETPENEAGWMTKHNARGYTLQKEGSEITFAIKVLNDADIKIALRGPDRRDENNAFIPVWADFTSVTINGEEILSEPTPVWHSKAFFHIINAKAGEEYKIHAEWTKHTEE